MIRQCRPFKEFSSDILKIIMVEFLAWQLENICLFCGSGLENITDFINAIRDLGRVLGKR